MGLNRIISGGQTGVDRAGLDAAMEAQLSTGGWCPPGGIANDGQLSGLYSLDPTPMDHSPEASDVPRSQRTEWNVRDSDGTLVVIPGRDVGDAGAGTQWTITTTRRHNKPLLVVDPALAEEEARVMTWLSHHRISVLNVAGPSEEECPGIYQLTKEFLLKVFAKPKG
jgi:hypothetical protein